LVSEARVNGELVWEERSTMLRRGGGGSNADRAGGVGETISAAPPAESSSPATGPARSNAGSQWKLPGDLGRRYGSVSGDRNPIHIHALTARAFGFKQAIAHGMWTKARALAALEPLPDAYTVDVQFKKPIFLPSRVTFAADDGRFAVRSAKHPDTIHLEGTVTP
jgi:acyl dehydratase